MIVNNYIPMSELILNNINIYEQVLDNSIFVVGDVVNGGGYEDPALINSEEELTRKFRFAKNYKAYLEIVRQGGTLALAGNRKTFTDIPTLVIFNQNPVISNPEILFANPSYEFLTQNFDEIWNSIKGKINFNDYTGFTSDYSYTYKIIIKPIKDIKDEVINKKRKLTLVLPKRPSSVGRLDNFGILFQRLEDGKRLPATSNVPKGYDGVTGYIGNVLIEETDTNVSIFNKILNVENQGGTKLIDLYYVNGEKLYIAGEEGDEYLVLETPYPIKYFNFCKTYCDIFEFKNDAQFTQNVYYLRGLKNQGIAISAYSRAANSEGRNIDLRVTNGTLSTTLDIELLDESHKYIGSLDSGNDNYLLKTINQNPLLVFDIINKSTTIGDITYETKINNGIYETNSFELPEFDESSLIAAYNSFLEYEIAPAVIIAPPNILEYKRTELIPLLTKFTQDLYLGGFSSTILIQEEDPNVITVMTKLFNTEKLFWFSGSFKFDSIYQYIIKWLKDRNFSADSGCECITGNDLSNTVRYNDYEIIYDENSDFIISISLSTVLSKLFNVLSPGITLQKSKEMIQSNSTRLINFNPQIRNIIVNKIEQIKNTLYVDLDITYTGIPNLIKVNFKIYRNYGN